MNPQEFQGELKKLFSSGKEEEIFSIIKSLSREDENSYGYFLLGYSSTLFLGKKGEKPYYPTTLVVERREEDPFFFMTYFGNIWAGGVNHEKITYEIEGGAVNGSFYISEDGQAVLSGSYQFRGNPLREDDRKKILDFIKEKYGHIIARY